MSILNAFILDTFLLFVGPSGIDNGLLQENGDFLLQEDGGYIIL